MFENFFVMLRIGIFTNFCYYLLLIQVLIVSNGVRGCGYLFLHLLENDQPIPSSILTPFARVSIAV